MTDQRQELMFKNKQLVCDKIKGDCFRACLTSILGIPNSTELPDCGDGWAGKWYTFLYNRGLSMKYDEERVWREGFWIASVPSKNFEGVTHSIIMLGQEVYFDPSPKETYSTGQNLLGKNVVIGGWWLEVNNIEKLFLADRRRILADVEEPLKAVDAIADFTGKTSMWKVAQDYETGVDEALTRIAKHKGEQ